MRNRLLILLFMVPLAGCASGLPKIDLSINGVNLRIEVARTDKEREQGLMFRKSLGPREGMLFVFDVEQHLEFWMKNTPLPLSVAFLSTEGKILQIDDMQPFSLETIRSRLSARYALEMNQGAFQQIGARVGDMVVFPQDFRR